MTRLERERADADRRYHDALAALDAAVRGLDPVRPAVEPPAYDASQLPRLNEHWRQAGQRIQAAASEMGGGLGGRLRRLVWRLVSPIFQAQHDASAALVDHLNRNVAAHEGLSRAVGALADAVAADRAASARLHTDLVLFLQTITQYVDTKDRALGGPELREQIVLISERAMATSRALDRLQAQGAGRRAQGPGPATEGRAPEPRALSPEPTDFSYVGFEDRFRGSEEEIRARLADYVPVFQGAPGPVLDVGCGRGELLALLSEAGIPARGIDLNAEMVALCRERGLTADQADALTFLEAQADGSLGGLSAIQVVEHLDPRYLTRFLETAFHKLAPGAPIVLETINPACWMAFFEAYLRDLTHAQPIHADVLRFMVQAAGFSSVDVQYRSPVTEADRLDRIAGADIPSHAPPALRETIAAVNAHAEKLNARLFGFMDYAVVGRR